MKILLIAGHGGSPYDSGAVGCGYTEAVETRRMANAVAPLLRAYGFEVALYDQSKDAYKVVTQGGSLPLSGVSYVMEFHLNAAANDPNGNGVTTGTEIFVHTNETGITVEQAILKHVCALGFKNRGVKRSSGLAVLKNVHKNGISHALIETCFIDDKDDMKLYGNKFNQIAQAIADGVAEGFGYTTTQNNTESKVDDEEEMKAVKKNVSIDGKIYQCDVIEKDDTNYVQMADLAQAGYGITYDANTQVPGMIAPKTRIVDKNAIELTEEIQKIKDKCGLEDQTIDYLCKYLYGDDLIKKIANAL